MTAVNIVFSKKADEEHAMRSKSDNKEFMTYYITNGFVDKLFESMFSRY